MERAAGEVRLYAVRCEGGARLVRCCAPGGDVFVPDALGGLPVVEVGPYAFSARAPELPAGAFCTPAQGGCDAHDAAAIRSVALPQSVRSIGDYAFYGCTGLVRLSVGGVLESVGSDAFMNCWALRRLYVRGEGGLRACVQQVLREYAGELTVDLETPRAQLLFPAFSEEYEELAAPHIFHYNIDGAGYACRQCFEGRQLRFGLYDAAQRRLLAAHEFEAAARAALGRLRWPAGLTPTAREAYRQTLAAHGEEALRWLLRERDAQGLAFLLGLGLLPRAALAAGCAAARKAGDTEALGLLLESEHRHFGAPAGASADFSL